MQQFLQQYNNRLKQKRGFTLIELLVVVSIIALLSSISVYGLQEARKRAEVAKFQQQFAQLKTAVALYESDNGSFPVNNTGTIQGFLNTLNATKQYFPGTWDVPAGIAALSQQFFIPGVLLGGSGSENNPSCGTPDYDGVIGVYYFDFNSGDYPNSFEFLYLDGEIDYDYGCFHF